LGWRFFAPLVLLQHGRTHSIRNGHFTGIGAVSELTCGYYELSEKKYYFTDYTDMVEVVSLTGTIMLKDAEPFIHMHGVFTDTKNHAFGGHIVEMRVGVTLEVVLTPLTSNFVRLPDACSGLALIDLPEKVDFDR
jgi:uncharacterized protein